VRYEQVEPLSGAGVSGKGIPNSKSI